MNLAQLNREKLLKVRDLTSYKNSHQRELNVFIQKCNEIFETRRLIYNDDVDKILYARNMLIEILAQKWEQKRKITFINIMKWVKFVDYLQKLLNLTHLKIIDAISKFKILKQRFHQTIAKLIVYVN